MTRIIRYRDSEQSTPPNYAMEFDGFSQRFELIDPEQISGAISITGWFNSSETPNDGTIVALSNGDRFEPWKVYLNAFDGALAFVLTNAGGQRNVFFSERKDLNDGVFHNFTCVFDNGSTRTSMQMYIDGELDSVFPAVSVGIYQFPFGVFPLTIGMVGSAIEPGSGPWFNGLIDDVVVFDDIILDPLQVAQIYAGRARINMLPFMPKYWWKMGDDSVFDGDRWIVPDAVGAFDMMSQNMDFSNRQPGVPEL